MKTDNQQPSRLLTEDDLKVGNRFECIKTSEWWELRNAEAVKFHKGEIYKVEIDGTIYNGNGYDFFIDDKPKFRDFLNRHFKLSHQPQEEVKEEMTAEKLFLSKYGNKITASESWVIRFAEDYANQKTLSLQQENERLREENKYILSEIIRRKNIIQSEPNGRVRETMINDLLIGLPI